MYKHVYQLRYTCLWRYIHSHKIYQPLTTEFWVLLGLQLVQDWIRGFFVDFFFETCFFGDVDLKVLDLDISAFFGLCCFYAIEESNQLRVCWSVMSPLFRDWCVKSFMPWQSVTPRPPRKRALVQQFYHHFQLPLCCAMFSSSRRHESAFSHVVILRWTAVVVSGFQGILMLVHWFGHVGDGSLSWTQLVSKSSQR